MMYLSILKHLLIRPFALLLLLMSQMSIQMINISDLGETLMIRSFYVRTMLSKIWFRFIMSSTSFGVRRSFELSQEKYEMPIIFK